MLRGLYSVATAMDAVALNHDLIAHNLAHVTVPGFRRSVAGFETFETRLAAQQAGEGTGGTGGAANGPIGATGPGSSLGARFGEVENDFAMGRLETTGRTLDVALTRPEGFFVLEGPTGPLYTRNGSFHIGVDGDLVTADGMQVRGTGGPINFPADASPASIRIGTDGAVFYDGAPIGQLEIAEFADPKLLIRAGTTTFEAPPEAGVQPSDTPVAQGMRESSNVSSVEEMIRMIAGMRHFEASQRAMRSIGEAVHEHTNPQAR